MTHLRVNLDVFSSSREQLELAAREVRFVLEQAAQLGSRADVQLSSFLPLDPAFLVTAANLVTALRNQGVRSIAFVSLTRELETLLYASGFHRVLNLPDDHNFEWLIPLTNFTATDPHVIGEIARGAAETMPNIPDKIDRLYQCLSELTENVRVHSECPWGGFFAGRVFQLDKLTRISVADFGKGVFGTLGSIYPYNPDLGHDVLLYEAFKYWVTGKPGQRAGSGLPFVTEFVRDVGGVVRAYSGRGCIRLDSTNTCLYLSENPYPGMLVTLDLPSKN